MFVCYLDVTRFGTTAYDDVVKELMRILLKPNMEFSI